MELRVERLATSPEIPGISGATAETSVEGLQRSSSPPKKSMSIAQSDENQGERVDSVDIQPFRHRQRAVRTRSDRQDFNMTPEEMDNRAVRRRD